MLLVDVNVLLNAANMASSRYAVCNRLLDQMVNGTEPFALSEMILSGFLRIATNPKAFTTPMSLDEALAFANAIRASSCFRRIEPGPGHWQIFETLCRELRITGPRITDAYLAALAIEHQCDWVSDDKGFVNFTSLRWRTPDQV